MVSAADGGGRASTASRNLDRLPARSGPGGRSAPAAAQSMGLLVAVASTQESRNAAPRQTLQLPKRRVLAPVLRLHGGHMGGEPTAESSAVIHAFTDGVDGPTECNLVMRLFFSDKAVASPLIYRGASRRCACTFLFVCVLTILGVAALFRFPPFRNERPAQPDAGLPGFLFVSDIRRVCAELLTTPRA